MQYTMSIKKRKDGWAGTIEMKVPPNHERMTVMATHKVSRLVTKSKTKEDEHQAYEVNSVILGGLYRDVRSLIQKVDLTGPKGERVETLEQFEYHPDLVDMPAEVALQYISGFGPGKNSSQS